MGPVLLPANQPGRWGFPLGNRALSGEAQRSLPRRISPSISSRHGSSIFPGHAEPLLFTLLTLLLQQRGHPPASAKDVNCHLPFLFVHSFCSTSQQTTDLSMSQGKAHRKAKAGDASEGFPSDDEPRSFPSDGSGTLGVSVTCVPP